MQDKNDGSPTARTRPHGEVRSLQQFAQLAGVSASTVSRALADNPLTSPQTRKRIQALARKVGFSVNPAASMLRTRLTKTISLVLPMGRETSQPLSDPFCSTMLGLITDLVSDRGYDLLVKRVDPDGSDWLKPIIDARRVDGVIVIGQSDQDDILATHSDGPIPIVVWGQWQHDQSYTTVGVDNVAGGRLAADHLLSRGRRRFGFIGNIDLPEFAARYQGFSMVLPSSGVETVVVRPKNNSFEDGYDAAVELFERMPNVDGVFAGSDVIAISITRAARECGLKVPEDIGVIGFDDISLAAHNDPPLTTIRQDQAAGAALLCDRLFQKLSGEEAVSIMLPPKLIVRATT